MKRTIVKTPAALRILIPLIGISCVIFIAFGIAPPVLPKDLLINGMPLPEMKFQNTWILILLGVLGGGLTLGLQKARNWARYAAVIWPFVTYPQRYVFPLQAQSVVGEFIHCALLSGIMYWYFFKKKNVVEYFDANQPASSAG